MELWLGNKNFCQLANNPKLQLTNCIMIIVLFQIIHFTLYTTLSYSCPSVLKLSVITKSWHPTTFAIIHSNMLLYTQILKPRIIWHVNASFFFQY